MPVEGLAERGAERDGVAVLAGAFAQLVPGGENLAAFRREGVHRRAMAPAGDRMTDLARDARDRVVIGRCARLGRFLSYSARRAVMA